MRPIIAILIALLPLGAAAQNPLKYEEVIDAPGADKAELYRRAKHFFVQHFNDANEVLQTQNEAGGELVGRGWFAYTGQHWIYGGACSGKVWQIMSIYVKDGKYKFIATQFIHEGTKTSNYPAMNFGLIQDTDMPPPDVAINCQTLKGFCSKEYAHIKKRIDESTKTTLAELKAAMSKPSPAGDDW